MITVTKGQWFPLTISNIQYGGVDFDLQGATDVKAALVSTTGVRAELGLTISAFNELSAVCDGNIALGKYSVEVTAVGSDGKNYRMRSPLAVLEISSSTSPSNSSKARIQGDNWELTADVEMHEGQARTYMSLLEEARKATLEAKDKADAATNRATDALALANESKATADAQAKTLTDTNAAIEDAEAKRVAAEQSRVGAENARAEAENARQDNEQTRKDAEAARKDAENERATAESSRAVAEGKRAAAENARNEAETTRQNNEQSRKDAEVARKDAENERATAESSRAVAEGKRAAAETERETAFANAKKAAEDATSAANKATSAANTAAQSANDAKTAATTAATNANDAAKTATDAAKTATDAAGKADQATENAQDATSLAQTAATSANNASANAQTAETQRAAAEAQRAAAYQKMAEGNAATIAEMQRVVSNITNAQSSAPMTSVPASIYTDTDRTAGVGETINIAPTLFAPSTCNHSVIYNVYSGNAKVDYKGDVVLPSEAGDSVIEVIPTLNNGATKVVTIHAVAPTPILDLAGEQITDENGDPITA